MCQTDFNQTQCLVWSVIQAAPRCHIGAGTPNPSSLPALMKTSSCICSSVYRKISISSGNNSRIFFNIDVCLIFSLGFLQCGALIVAFCFMQQCLLNPDFPLGGGRSSRFLAKLCTFILLCVWMWLKGLEFLPPKLVGACPYA